MISRHVLAALATGVSANDEDAARAALGRIDLVLRGAARRRMERALIDAALACDASGLPSPPPDHLMRLAALQIAGTPSGEVANPAAVVAAYGALPPARRSRLPLVTLLCALIVLSIAGGIAAYVITRPGPPARSYVRTLPPPSAEAFKTGGTPLADPAIDKLLREELTTLVVDANQLGGNDRERLLAKLRAPEPILAKGKDLAKAWDAMLDAFEASVALSQAGQAKPQTQDMLRESIREMSEAFIAVGLGYHLEGRFRGAFPIIQAYRVEQVVFVKTGAAPRRVLSLRRLDRLNTSWAVLGMHDEDAGDPTLHLDRIDVNVATFVLPVLAGGRPYKLGDDEWMLWDKNKATATAIGDVIRKDYASALGADADKAQQSASLLVKRGDIIDEWRDKLGRKDIYFITIDELFVPQSLLDSLEGKVSNTSRRKVSDIDTKLAELEAPRIHSRIHDLVAATVRRHEAQHGFDYDRETELRYPQALQDLLGSPHDGDGNERPLVRSARAELSAYLSQTLNDPHTPHAAFWHLVRNVFDRNDWGTGEFYAALVAIEGVAKQLGADTSTPRRKDGQFDRDRASAFATLIASQSPDKLRAATRALWTELYGEPPTDIVDVPPPALPMATPK
jgi:hypothetical protein